MDRKNKKSFPSFMEYMDEKGKVVDKPDVETVPDYHGPDEKYPPNSKVPYKTQVANKKPAAGESGMAELGDSKLKYDPTKGSKEEVRKEVMKEYMDEKGKVLEKGVEDIKGQYRMKTPASPPGGGYKYISTSVKAGEKGLGELGEKELVYEPDTKNSPKVKTKTEGFLDKTKGMSLSEFTKYMLEECGCGQVQGDDLPYVTAYTTGKFQPHPPEVIRYISVLANKNEGILENLVSQMISMGYLGKLMKMIFEHPQAYEEMVSLFDDEESGPARCKSFVGAMNNSYGKFVSDHENMYESVSSPIGFEDEIDMDSEDDEDYESDEDEEDYDSEDDYEDEEIDFDSEEDSEDLGDEDHDSEESEEDFKDEDFDSEENIDMDSEEEERPRQKKLKKKFAHDHLLDAMRNHEHMLKKMKG